MSGTLINLKLAIALITSGTISLTVAMSPRVGKVEAIALGLSGTASIMKALYSGRTANSKEWENAIDSSINEVVLGGIGAIATLKIPQKSKRIAKVALKNLPEPLSHVTKQVNSREVFQKFLKFPHNRIVGPTGSGKTFLLCALLVQWLQNNPDGIVTIADINYGKPDRTTGEVFDWLGMPLQAVKFNESDIFQTLENEVRVLSERKELCRLAAINKERVPKLQPRLFIVSEWDGTAKSLNNGKGKDGKFSQAALEIFKQGNGYNMKVIVEGQSLSVGESDLSQSSRSQTAIAMLGTDCYDTRRVAEFGTPNTDELITQSSQLKKQKKRPCIIQLGDGLPQTIAVTNLSAQRNTQIEYCPDPNSPAGRWKAIRENIPDLEEKLSAIAQQITNGELVASTGSGGPVKAFVLPVMGLKNADLSSELWHKYGKPFWNQIKEKYE